MTETTGLLSWRLEDWRAVKELTRFAAPRFLSLSERTMSLTLPRAFAQVAAGITATKKGRVADRILAGSRVSWTDGRIITEG